MANLRRFWLVIYGEAAPEGEMENARKIADHIRSQLNIVRVLPSTAPALRLLTKLANIITVGGPLANEWTFNLNDYINPKWDITILREREAGESYYDWITNPEAVQINGFIKNETKYAGAGGVGIIGAGNQPLLRIRPLQVFHIGGWWYCDTCALSDAFIADSGPGVYQTSCTEETPPEEPCPAGLTYTKIADP